jgi:hypothetical protein
MHRKLTTDQVREVCEEMLLQTETPSVRTVMAELRQRYGACGRTERVASVLRSLTEKRELRSRVSESSDLASLRQKLLDAEERAARAEYRELRHQDLWARRYQEKVAELQHRVATSKSTGVSSEQYLRLYRRAVELAGRLARYEPVEHVLEPGGQG